MGGETLQQKITHKRREDSKLQDLQRQEDFRECIWNISEQIQGLNGQSVFSIFGQFFVPKVSFLAFSQSFIFFVCFGVMCLVWGVGCNVSCFGSFLNIQLNNCL